MNENERLFTNLGVKYAYITSLHDVNTEDGYVSDYYSSNSFEADVWGSKVNDPPRSAIMRSDRIYADPVSNIMRFKVSNGEVDPVNDYYCVAMGPGFSRDAAKCCGKNTMLYEFNNGIAMEIADYGTWGYTFRVNFIDDNSSEYHINVIMVDVKDITDSYSRQDPYTTHTGSFIEFIMKYDPNADKHNTEAFRYTPYGRDGDEKNLDYDKFFGGTNVRVQSVYPYCDGWMIQGTYSDGYTIRDDRYGIPTVHTDMYEQGYFEGRNTFKVDELEAASNGVYVAEDNGFDGYDRVTVNVAQGNSMSICDLIDKQQENVFDVPLLKDYHAKICELPSELEIFPKTIVNYNGYYSVYDPDIHETASLVRFKNWEKTVKKYFMIALYKGDIQIYVNSYPCEMPDYEVWWGIHTDTDYFVGTPVKVYIHNDITYSYSGSLRFELSSINYGNCIIKCDPDSVQTRRVVCYDHNGNVTSENVSEFSRWQSLSLYTQSSYNCLTMHSDTTFYGLMDGFSNAVFNDCVKRRLNF